MISIIIPALNEAHWLPHLLQSIRAQKECSYEIIVADGGSCDDTVAIAVAEGCRITKGGTPAEGRNRGAEIARSKHLLFLDADVILPANDFLVVMLKQMEVQAADIATCSVYPISDYAVDFLLHGVVNKYINLTKNRYPHIPGFCILVKKEIHDRIGGFDEKLRLAEDHEYIKRASRIGCYKIFSTPKIFVSVRRLEKEGRMKIALKYLYVELYRLFKGEIMTQIVAYDLGQHSKNPGNGKSGHFRIREKSWVIQREKQIENVF